MTATTTTNATGMENPQPAHSLFPIGNQALWIHSCVSAKYPVHQVVGRTAIHLHNSTSRHTVYHTQRLYVCVNRTQPTLPYDGKHCARVLIHMSCEQIVVERAFYPKISIHLAAAGY